MLNPILVIIAGLAASYYGTKLLLAPSGSYICNQGVQSFELANTTIYWRVQEGVCGAHDLNYNAVLKNIEQTLNVPDPLEVLTPATCSYAVQDKVGFVFSYGTDYYEVDSVDCLAPLAELRKEEEEKRQIEIEKMARKEN